MTKITFIINPISGHGRKKTIEKNIAKYLDSSFSVNILYTQAAKHAIELSKTASIDSEIIVAVGGDGSIHEVAQALVNSSTKLAIIPMGSGNGLARHLKIPLKIKQAIELINNGNAKSIDVLDFGNSYSINVSGLGFDAHIAHKFATYHKRGFMSYIKLTINEFLKYKAQNYKIIIDNKEAFETEAFLISIANSAQFGNNAYIAPQAVIDDGFFDLVIISSFRKRQSLDIGIKLFTKKIDQSKLLTIYKVKNVHIESEQDFAIHQDGEAIGKVKELNVSIKPSSLKVIIP